MRESENVENPMLQTNWKEIGSGKIGLESISKFENVRIPKNFENPKGVSKLISLN